MHIYKGNVETPMAEWILYKTTEGLCLITTHDDVLFAERYLKKFFEYSQIIHDDSLFENEIQQIRQYTKRERKTFNLNIVQKGTAFQKRVWQALQCIPYGETVHYSDVAREIGQPKATRAVSRAIGQNPLLLITPCHRVIGKDGSLTGYRSGLPLKHSLLKLENVILKNV